MRYINARRVGGCVAFALIATTSMANAQTTAPSLAPVPIVSEDQKVAALLKLIADTVASMPAKSRSQDIEGRLSFAIDQAQPDCSSSKAALAQAASNPKLSAAARVALRNIGSVLSRCQNTGTAALAAAQSIVRQGSSLSLGGGTSNYVRP